MENGLNVLRTIKAGSPVDIYPDVSFGETVRSTLSYKYSPILDRFSEARSFPDQPENGYKAINNIPEGMEEYGSTLLRATNQEHMDYLISTVKKSQDNRLK